ncbi:uncharacterized protein LOC109613124 isoform X2 [Musca domestica]|uniref:Uncharacterized protein LOC109613124 isoform X2 n=1 Tax=Musca domestica TaxID=7370 RepID=A0A9J7IFJ6_MUSDO|nr:uncharacterized protein LOC109613124 isoform X2 [Musca domestica]
MGKGDKKAKKDKGKKDQKAKTNKPPQVEEIVPEIPPEPQPDQREEQCVRYNYSSSYPLCQPRRCPRSLNSRGYVDPETSFTCLCPVRRLPSEERPTRLYACDGTVLIFPKKR